ncbi:unnamed protein product [Lymnaea stagnalis]|uniref:Uncharacterized protein n=1 Tax=Lymnaea stagnalis TaxID=6523 RepID=A0AAV2IAG3_LYMST
MDEQKFGANSSQTAEMTSDLLAPPPYSEAPQEYTEYASGGYVNIMYTNQPYQQNYGSVHTQTSPRQTLPEIPSDQKFPIDDQQPVGTQELFQTQQHEPPGYYHAQPPAAEGYMQPPSLSRNLLTGLPPLVRPSFIQPHQTQVVESIKVGRRKTLSHVTDLETGKEYDVMKKVSRTGRRSKEVIKEVGGPTTIVKQTPSRTIIRHK